MSSSSEAPVRVLRGRAARRATPMSLSPVVGADASPSAERPSLDAGWAEGWAAGYEAGAEAARTDAEAAAARHAAAVEAALHTVDEAAAEWRRRETTALHHVEDALIDGALALARAVLDRELAVAVDPGADALARALRLAPPAGALTVRLHPDDVKTIAEVADAVPGDRPVRLVADGAVGRGGCVLESGDTTVDARIDSALARAAEAMAR